MSKPGQYQRNRDQAAKDAKDFPVVPEAAAAATDPRVTSAEPAERKTPRARIMVDHLIDRLQADIKGEGTFNGAQIKPLTPSQIRGIEILLNKALPNLQATTVSGDPDGVPVQSKHTHTVEFVNASARKSEV